MRPVVKSLSSGVLIGRNTYRCSARDDADDKSALGHQSVLPSGCLELVTTIPAAVAPAGSEVGEEDSSARLPPETANPLTVADPVSRTHSVPPSGASRASNGVLTPPPSGVLPSSVSEPSEAIAYREMLSLPVLTAKRNWPSCEISTQHGAVWRSGNGDPSTELSEPSVATSNADTVPLPTPLWAFETNT